MGTLVAVSSVKVALAGAANMLNAAITYLESPAGQATVVADMVNIDTVLADIGAVVPPVAVAANDLGIVIDLAKIGLPVIDALAAATPSPGPAPSTLEAWGSNFDDPNSSGT